MLMSGYFRLLVDPAVTDLWFLGEPADDDGVVIDARRFTSCQPCDLGHRLLHLPVVQPGRPALFSFAAFDMPVVDRALRDSFESFAAGEIQVIPASVDGRNDLAIINVLPCVDCIDESRTIGEKWTETSSRPEKVGTYRTIVKLYLDPDKLTNQIFRVAGWKIALIVSDSFVRSTSLASIEGLRLEPVT
jgi:hypothetical protein